MSSDLDKFVLQYSVELKDSIRKLEELQKKMQGVGKAHKESASQLKEFVTGASDELGKLIPGVNAVSTAVRGLGGAFALAGVGVAAFAVSVKAVMDLRANLNRQRLLGMELGVSGVRLEDYERKFVRASGGTLNRDQVDAGLKQFRQMGYAAYANSGGVESRRMQQLGVNPGTFGTPTGFKDNLAQLGKNMSGKTEEQVQALAQITGLSNDWLQSLRLLGPEINKITDLTMEDVNKRKKAEAEMEQLNKHISKFEEEIGKLGAKLGAEVLPGLTKFVGKLSDIVDWGKNVKPDTGAGSENFGGLAGWMSGATKDLWERGKYRWQNRNNPNAPSYDAAHGIDNTKLTEEEQRLLDEKVKAEDKKNEEAQKEADKMKSIIDQFSGSVTTFSGAISQQQAWAAWAGEIGKAGGLRTAKAASNDPRAVTTVQAGEAGAEGVIQQLMGMGWSRDQAAGIAANFVHESSLNPAATGDGGKAYGIGQWHPDRQAEFKKFAGKDIRDSSLAEQVAFANYELTQGKEQGAGRRLRGATSAAQAGDIVSRYYERPLAADKDAATRAATAGRLAQGGIAAGQSRQSLQLTQVQHMIASRLGIPVTQLVQGGVNRGDVAFASDQITGGLKNNIAKMRNEAAGSVGKVDQQTYAKMLRDIKDQERGLALMQQYAPGVVEGARAGGRDKTIGQFEVVINVNGAQDANIVAQKVHDQIRAEVLRALNMSATGTKG